LKTPNLLCYSRFDFVVVACEIHFIPSPVARR